VYKDGRVCISILHTAGDDPHGYETAAERWSPVQSASTSETRLLSGQSSFFCHSIPNSLLLLIY